MTDKSENEDEEIKMYAAESFVLRASIVLGLVAAVMTILYFTPYPDEYFVSCDRPCHDLDWPMICRVQLTLEPHQTQTSYCQDCTKNETNCDPKDCPMDDGKLRSTLTASLQLPGPAIQVCQNDILVVDVINRIPGKGLTIHWRGQPQAEAPFMDGVPMITQCPISSFTAFQYKFRATAAGTHIWHAHSGSDVLDGFHGALIIRQADRIDPHKKYYDFDEKEHVILISESTVQISTSAGEQYILPKTLLLNGKQPSEVLSSNPSETSTSNLSGAIFKVQPGKRYRFRLAYSGSVHSCPITLSVDQHLLKVIALDGNGMNPYEVSSVTFSKGERVDFVLKAKQTEGTYFLRVNSNCQGHRIEGLGLIKYVQKDGNKIQDKNQETRINKPTEENDVDSNHNTITEKINEVSEVKREVRDREFTTEMCDSVLGKVCAADASATKKIPPALKEKEIDRKLYLTFDYKTVTTFRDGTKEKPAGELKIKIYRMNNITFTYPSSPLLTQSSDVPSDVICNPTKKPKKCHNEDICECVHVEEIPLGASVELILMDQGGDSEENIFHLHGYNFYVVAHRKLSGPLTTEDARKMDEEGTLLKRNCGNPVLKDTVRVPKYGVVAIRFHASNPGYWMLRDEKASKWSRGMDIVFRVGGVCDVTNTPSNFPQCGSWVGPDFFLA